jgi:hypothetical protein
MCMEIQTLKVKGFRSLKGITWNPGKKSIHKLITLFCFHLKSCILDSRNGEVD